jgi:hypothetical protein
MSKLARTCGHVIFDQAASLPCKAHLFADQDADPLVDEPAGQIAAYAVMTTTSGGGGWPGASARSTRPTCRWKRWRWT